MDTNGKVVYTSAGDKTHIWLCKLQYAIKVEARMIKSSLQFSSLMSQYRQYSLRLTSTETCSLCLMQLCAKYRQASTTEPSV